MLAADLEKEKIKTERLENENNYLKDLIKNKLEASENLDSMLAFTRS